MRVTGKYGSAPTKRKAVAGTRIGRSSYFWNISAYLLMKYTGVQLHAWQ